MAELTDSDIPAVWERLALPGILDIHVHFMPEQVMRKVWAFFDDTRNYGRPWPITYRTSDDERLATLHTLGVRRFPSLIYPHKPGMAAWLNDWAAGFAAATPEVWQTLTFYPEPGADSYVTDALDDGATIGKAHLTVGDYDPRDSLLDPVWGQLADADVPVVVHCGHGPTPGRFTGLEPFRDVLTRHPRLIAVIAHMGMPDYQPFLDLIAGSERAYLDTTMAFTDFAQQGRPVDPDLRPQLADLGDRILFGSDFPNIPHSYAHAVETLQRLDLGDDWLRRVLWHNTAQLMGEPTSTT